MKIDITSMRTVLASCAAALLVATPGYLNAIEIIEPPSEPGFVVYRCTARTTAESKIDGVGCDRERTLTTGYIVRDLNSEGRADYGMIILDEFGAVVSSDPELTFQKVVTMTCPGTRPRVHEAFLGGECQEILDAQSFAASRIDGVTRNLRLRYEDEEEPVNLEIPNVAFSMRGEEHKVECSPDAWTWFRSRITYRLDRPLSEGVNDPAGSVVTLEDAVNYVVSQLEVVEG